MLNRVSNPQALTEQRFVFAEYFQGLTNACGVVEGRSGGRKRSFEAQFHGEWCNEAFLLDENFVYCDGKAEERSWRFRFDDNGDFTSTSVDVIGQGAGHHTRFGCQHTYSLTVPFRSRSVKVNMRESCYAFGQGRVLYRAQVIKWGILVATVSMAFSKV